MPSTFLPSDYEVPQASGKYMRLRPGSHLFRILAAPIMGWLGWTEINGERKPLRRPKDSGFRLDEVDAESIRHFWAMPVWNYAEKRVQVLEITQKTVQKAIEKYSRDMDWGEPYEYDLLVERTGEGLDTEYTVIPKPKCPLDSEVALAWEAIRSTFDLAKLFDGGDPFGEEASAPAAAPMQSKLAAQPTGLRDIFDLSKKVWPHLAASLDPKKALLKIISEELAIDVDDWGKVTQEQVRTIFMAMKNLEAKQFADSQPETVEDTASEAVNMDEIPF